MFIIEKIKNNWEIGLAGFLWFCVWATYNVDIFRIFSPGFPHNIFDLIHGLRSTLPAFALIGAIFILIKNKKINFKGFGGPLGLLLIYSIVGVFASLLSKNILLSFYWGVLYFSAIIILFAIAVNSKGAEKLSFIIKINWIIAGLIIIGMMVALLSTPGLFSFSTVTQFLHGGRPYESIGKIGAQINLFDMPGTRPTGLGRYAGIAAIVLFANIWRQRRRDKIVFLSLFALLLSILIFSRARTSVLAFVVAVLAILWFKSKSKGSFIFITGSICLLLFSTNFYQFSLAYLRGEDLLPGNNQIVLNAPNGKQAIDISGSNISNHGAGVLAGGIIDKNNEIIRQNVLDDKAIVTLSGRTNGVWADAWHLFLESPFVGFGFQADRIFLSGQHTHNSFLHALIQSGIVGALFFILALILSWVSLVGFLRVCPNRIILFEILGVLTFLTFRSITESSAFFGADFLFLAPIFAYIQYFDKNFERKNNAVNKAINSSDIYYNLKYFIKKKFPPFYFFVRTFRGYFFIPIVLARRKKWPKFFSQFLGKGDLCFDIGAHNGTQTDIFLKLGARVIAVEPQPLYKEIIEKYGSDKNLIVINKGLADKPGYLDLTIVDRCNSISTMSKKWKTEGRFMEDYNQAGTKLVTVPVATLDSLIAEYGVPRFCKIDVEGFEKEVLKGLTQPIPYISFEFMKEFLDDAKSCADHLSSIGHAKFNFSIADSMKLSLKDWVYYDELFLQLGKIRNRDLWGDIYVRFSK